MPTILRQYPEIFRTPKGIHLKVLGQTFTPRPGTESAQALADAALEIQIQDAIQTRKLTTPTFTTVPSWSVNHISGVGRFEMIVKGVELGSGAAIETVTMTIEMKIIDRILAIKAVHAFVNDSTLLQPNPHQRTRMERIAMNFAEQLRSHVPELVARTDEVVAVLLTDPQQAPSVPTVRARTLDAGDVIGWSFEGEPEVACTVVDVLPIASWGEGPAMRLSFTRNGDAEDVQHTRYLDLQQAVTLFSRG